MTNVIRAGDKVVTELTSVTPTSYSVCKETCYCFMRKVDETYQTTLRTRKAGRCRVLSMHYGQSDIPRGYRGAIT